MTAYSRAAYDRYVDAMMQSYREAFCLWLLTKEGDMPLIPLIYNYDYWRKGDAFSVRFNSCA